MINNNLQEPQSRENDTPWQHHIKIKKNIQAPLSRHLDKFKRSCRVCPKFQVSQPLIWISLEATYIFLLAVIDLILFTASGNLDIFRNGAGLSGEFLILSFCLFLFSGILMFALYRYPKTRMFLCSLATFIFVIILFRQFSLFDHHTFLGNALKYVFGSLVPNVFFTKSNVILALLLSVAVFVFMFYSKLVYFGFYVLLFFYALVGVLYNACTTVNEQHDFIESRFLSAREHVPGDQKFIYLMLPNLVSYKYFSEFNDDPEIKTTQEIISGFFAKNKFEVFPNSYLETDNTFSNMIKAVNPFDSKETADHMMQTMMLYKYWKFFNIGDEFLLLKDNEMFDTFRQAGYGISAYKSRGVDICHKEYGFNVDRCIEKLNRPANLYSRDLPLSDRSKLLFIEWLNSMGISKNMSFLYHTLRLFTRSEDLPMIGINYNNLYVVNSINTFDVLLDNILADQGRQAYFVYADIPSDMFIYDQFCRIKPQSSWISLKNLPWVDVDKTVIRRKAYADQTRCLYGKLQEFLDKLQKNDLLKNTVIAINGMSGTNNFQLMNYDDYDDDMFYAHLSILALKTPTNQDLHIREDLCSPTSFLNRYLYKAKSCQGPKFEGVHKRAIKKFQERLGKATLTEDQARASIPTYENWIAKWNEVNVNPLATINVANLLPKDRTTEKNKTKAHIPTLVNDVLKSDTVPEVEQTDDDPLDFEADQDQPAQENEAEIDVEIEEGEDVVPPEDQTIDVNFDDNDKTDSESEIDDVSL